MTEDVFEQLRAAILEAARLTFTKLRAEHGDEHFYVFGLFTNDGSDYICHACNTLEGLEAKAHEYFAKSPEIDLESWRNDLRWSFGDFKYFCTGFMGHVTGVEQLLLKYYEINKAIDPDPDLDDENWIFHRTRAYELCIEVMQQLDCEGFFGIGDKRNQITLLVFDGHEYPNDRFERAKLMNPDVVIQRMAQEVELENAVIERRLAIQRERHRKQN